MATHPQLEQALVDVQQVIGSPVFVALTADAEVLAACEKDALGQLHAHGIALPASIQSVEVRRRHTTQAAWGHGWRTGGLEWRFFVQPDEIRYRIVLLADPWPAATPKEVDTE